MLGDRANLLRLLVVDVVDDALPGAFHAARVHVDLDEAVHRVHGRLAILDPGDVERFAVRVVAGLVEANQRLERQCQRLGRIRDGIVQMRDDAANLGVVEAADAVDLFDEPAVLHRRVAS